jgi:hypothetical protein
VVALGQEDLPLDLEEQVLVLPVLLDLDELARRITRCRFASPASRCCC